jgi:serine/threonine-protein kinase ATR
MVPLLLALSVVPPKPLMRDFMGLNTHTVQFRPDLYRPVTRLLRNYHPVEWDLGKDPASSDPKLPLALNGVDWSQLYGGWRKAGYRTLASLQFESIEAGPWQNAHSKASPYGSLFARTFGPSSPSPSVEAVEIGNEPVSFDDTLYRTLYEQAAKGLRAGDSKLKIGPCAVAVGTDDKYSRDLKVLEGLEKYIDFLNVHTYAFAEHWPTWRRSHPEDTAIPYLKQVEQVIEWRDRHAPGRPVWITEFGYDASTQPTPKEGDFSKFIDVSDEVQAQYIVRSFLMFASMDVERAYLYWFNDNDEPKLHAASGLTRNYQPKPSFHAVADLHRRLGDYRYSRTILKKETFAFEFVKSPRERIWVVWNGTGTKREVSVHLPKPKGRIISAERMPLAEGPAPKATLHLKRDGTLTLKAGPSPTYIRLQG